MKSLLWFGILSVFSSFAQAGSYSTPLLCPLEDSTLVVENQSPEAQPFWFQAVGTAPFKEAYVEVKAQGRLQLPLSDWYRDPQAAVAVKTHHKALSFKVVCKSQQQTWSLNSQNSPWKKATFRTPAASLKLFAANLSQQKNNLQITLRTRAGTVTRQSFSLSEEFVSESLDLTLPEGIVSVEIKGEGRWSGKLFADLQEIALQDQVRTLASVPNKRYFLFRSTDPDNRDSFVVPMESAKLIQESLEQIKDPGKARLFVGRIEKTTSGQNRNFSEATKTPWSWLVAEAQNYADLAHISCNGTPGLVEERLNSWLVETGGTICFWNYRVVRELKPEEIKQAPSWSHLGPQSLPHTH